MKAQNFKSSILQYAMEGGLRYLNQTHELTTHNISDSIQLNVPKSWDIMKLEDVATVVRGGSPRPISSYITNDEDGINWIKIGDTTIGGKYIEKTSQKIKPSGLNKTRLVHEGALLLSNSMSFGRPYISKITGAIHDGWLSISEYEDKLDKNFLYYLLSSNIALEQFQTLVSGTTVKNLTRDKVKSIIIPIPSLDEQLVIVNKLEALLEKVEQYDILEKKITSLNNNFPINMEKSILQNAFEGKLVSQDINDENAIDLIKRIDTKKMELKKDKENKFKSSSKIGLDETPYNIPSTWQWVRISDIVYSKGQKKPDSLFRYIDVTSIDNNLGQLKDNPSYLDPEKAPSRARKIVNKGDIIYSTIRPYLKNICILEEEDKHDVIASTAFAVMTPIIVENTYLYYFLKSPQFNNYVEKKMNGVAYPAINEKNFYSALIPLPPIEEQKRIVNNIEELLRSTNLIREAVK